MVGLKLSCCPWLWFQWHSNVGQQLVIWKLPNSKCQVNKNCSLHLLQLGIVKVSVIIWRLPVDIENHIDIHGIHQHKWCTGNWEQDWKSHPVHHCHVDNCHYFSVSKVYLKLWSCMNIDVLLLRNAISHLDLLFLKAFENSFLLICHYSDLAIELTYGYHYDW